MYSFQPMKNERTQGNPVEGRKGREKKKMHRKGMINSEK